MRKAKYPCYPGVGVGECKIECGFQRLKVFVRHEEGPDAEGIGDAEGENQPEQGCVVHEDGLVGGSAVEVRSVVPGEWTRDPRLPRLPLRLSITDESEPPVEAVIRGYAGCQKR